VFVVSAGALAVIVMAVYVWITPKTAPSFSDVWNAKMEIKYSRKVKKQSRTKYLWEEKADLWKATVKYVFCLQMFRPQYAYTFATCGLFHLCFDLVMVLSGSAWFMMRLMGVCIFLSIFGGIEKCVMQVKFCYDQRKRITTLDYGVFEPESVQEIKKALADKHKIENFKMELPMLTLSIAELKELLPDIETMPGVNMDFIVNSFPAVTLPGMEIGLGGINLPGPCELIFGMVTEAVTELIGGILEIVFIFGEIGICCDQAFDDKQKKLKLKLNAEKELEKEQNEPKTDTGVPVDDRGACGTAF
jgi:hypothetical protein